MHILLFILVKWDWFNWNSQEHFAKFNSMKSRNGSYLLDMVSNSTLFLTLYSERSQRLNLFRALNVVSHVICCLCMLFLWQFLFWKLFSSLIQCSMFTLFQCFIGITLDIFLDGIRFHFALIYLYIWKTFVFCFLFCFDACFC